MHAVLPPHGGGSVITLGGSVVTLGGSVVTLGSGSVVLMDTVGSDEEISGTADDGVGATTVGGNEHCWKSSHSKIN